MDSLPPLVDRDTGYVTPPAGVATGGHPGYYNAAFPGVDQPHSAAWPSSAPAQPGNWTSTWNQQPPASAPAWPSQGSSWQPPGQSEANDNPWARPQTPGWGPQTPAAGWPSSANATSIPYSSSQYGSPYSPTDTRPSLDQSSTNWYASQPDSLARSTSSSTVASPRLRHLLRAKSASYGGSSEGGDAYIWGAYGPVLDRCTYTSRDLARRPRDWRPDYTPKGGLASYMSAISRSPTTVEDYSDNTRRKLHALMTPGAIRWDVRLPPTRLTFTTLSREYNILDLYQMACDPPADVMRLYNQHFPWYIDIRKTQPNGITIQDLVTQLFIAFSETITQRHYFNDAMDDEDRQKIARAFELRCGGESEIINQGIRKVDYLGPRYVFTGLARKGGIWEMKMKRTDQ